MPRPTPRAPHRCARRAPRTVPHPAPLPSKWHDEARAPSARALLHYCSITLSHYHTATLLHYCTTTPSHYQIVKLLHSNTTAPPGSTTNPVPLLREHYYTTARSHDHTTTPIQYENTARLHYCTITLSITLLNHQVARRSPCRFCASTRGSRRRFAAPAWV